MVVVVFWVDESSAAEALMFRPPTTPRLTDVVECVHSVHINFICISISIGSASFSKDLNFPKLEL